ncbi:MAG: condensation domain-containing protein [Chloroflexota bacterium]
MDDRNQQQAIGTHIAQLSIEDRIQLEERLLAGLQQRQPQTIPTHNRNDPAPLSFAQERLWFLAQLEPDVIAYNEVQAMRMKGMLDIAALERSLGALVARHDCLRICFREVNGTVMQIVGAVPAIKLPMHCP